MPDKSTQPDSTKKPEGTAISHDPPSSDAEVQAVLRSRSSSADRPEGDLIRDALAGDGSSFCQLVERFQGRLYNSMLNIVGSHDEAEDVVQESFVQAYLKLDSFQGNSKFFTWLYRIAFNNALSRQRRRRPEMSLEQSRELTGHDPEDRVEAPDEQLLRNERVNLVHAALRLLTDQHRHILILREMDEMSYEDIAEMLNINIGTVRSRLARARAQLKLHLEELQRDEMTREDKSREDTTREITREAKSSD